METFSSVLAIILGLLLRLAIPIVGTLSLIYFLRRLDARWQAEAQSTPVLTQRVECWKVRGCPEEQRSRCAVGSASLPCWQVLRQPNGYLQEKCLTCEVFTKAPLPTRNIEPRRT